jgi:hypothetical protein
MASNRESHAYDWRKGGEQSAPKPKAKKKGAPHPPKAKQDGELTAAKRKKLAASTFGLPATRGYPMPDKKHARLAKSGDSHALHVGNITAAQKKKIDAKANRILGE